MSFITCFGCGAQNVKAARFCTACGAPLALDGFISQKVDEKIKTAIRDRDVLEAESIQTVFDAVYNRFNLYGKIFVGLLVLVGLGTTWNIHSSLRAVDGAEKEILAKVRALNEIIDNSRGQIESAAKLQPEIEVLKTNLEIANLEIQKQKEITASSEDFAKAIFSSRVRVLVDPNKPPSSDFVFLSSQTKHNVTSIYILLPSVPIPETLELLFHLYVQPPNTYEVIHNLIIFNWGDSVESLQQHQLIASYFPDKSDAKLIRKLEIHGDHVFGDGEQLPKLDGDPDFHGNIWMNEDGSLKGGSTKSDPVHK